MTGYSTKVYSISYLFQTLLVKNKQGFEDLSPVLGMLSYREDKKHYVNKGNEWDAIGSEKEVSLMYGFLN